MAHLPDPTPDPCAQALLAYIIVTSFYKPSSINSGALAREARSGAPWVKKCGKLPIRENLVIT